MAKIDIKFHELLQHILDNGREYEDPNRKGVHRIQIPHYSFEYDLSDGFPAVTTKKLHFESVVGELLWFLKGSTDIRELWKNNIHIWDKDHFNYCTNIHGETEYKAAKLTYKKMGKVDNIDKYYDLGRIYGALWKKWKQWYLDETGYRYEFKYLDQISNLIKNLKEKPLSTEHIVTAWNPAELDEMALPPCHKGFQLMVYELSFDERLKLLPPDKKFRSEFGWHMQLKHKNIPKYGFDLVWEQRSVDTFLGLPFNIASYALLAHIIGKIVNMVPGKIYGDLRNVHIYDNAIDAVKKQLSRDVNKYDDINLEIYNKISKELHEKPLDEVLKIINIKDFNLLKYKSYPSIKAEMLSRD